MMWPVYLHNLLHKNYFFNLCKREESNGEVVSYGAPRQKDCQFETHSRPSNQGGRTRSKLLKDLVVKGGDSQSEGHKFESLDGFFTLICCKICVNCLKRPKINEKEAEDGPLTFFLKEIAVHLETSKNGGHSWDPKGKMLRHVEWAEGSCRP